MIIITGDKRVYEMVVHGTSWTEKRPQRRGGKLISRSRADDKGNMKKAMY
jgi:hypothetical protein